MRNNHRVIVLLVVGVLLAALAVLAVWRAVSVLRADYYESWIIDRASLLSQETHARLRDIGRRTDQEYGCVIGVLTLPDAPDGDLSKLAYDAFDDYGFGGNDLLIVLSVADRQSYLAYGDNLALYAGSSLRETALSRMTDDIYGEEANAAVRALFDDLESWLRTHVPPANGQTYGRSRTTSGGAFLRVLLLALALGAATWAAVRYVIRPQYRDKRKTDVRL